MTRADMSPEWYAYIHMRAFVSAEDRQPGIGLSLAARNYGLSYSDAAALLEVVRSVKDEMAILAASKADPICFAGISSSREYLDWWIRFEDKARVHRRATIDALLSALDASIWESVLAAEYLAWLKREDFGDRINYQVQIDIADYRVWMRGICG